MRKILPPSDYSTDKINAVKISPELFYDFFKNLAGRFGLPLHHDTKEYSLLSVTLFVEQWAMGRFEDQAVGKLVSAVVYCRYMAYTDAISDLFVGREHGLTHGHFDWFDAAFIAAAATTPLDHLEMEDETYKACFLLKDFADHVRDYAGFYNYVDALPPCQFNLVSDSF